MNVLVIIFWKPRYANNASNVINLAKRGRHLYETQIFMEDICMKPKFLNIFKDIYPGIF